MSSFGVSQLNLSGQLTLAIASGQRQLDQLQGELATGRHADIGLHLGPQMRADLQWRNEASSLQQISDSNSLAQTRAKLTQDSLSALGELAAKFISNLAEVPHTSDGQRLAAQTAATIYQQLVAIAGANFDGQYLFGGINSRQPPLSTYEGSQAQGAVAAAFQGAFGFTQSDPRVSSISPAAMQAFLDGPHADIFQSPGWRANWSNASDAIVRTRIDVSETVGAATTANITPIRQFVQALTMVADLGAPEMAQSAFQRVTATAMTLAGSAQAGLAEEQSSIGLAQSAIASANEMIDQRISALHQSINQAETVDKYETATRINTTMAQLEASYTLTGRISQLNLLKFI